RQRRNVLSGRGNDDDGRADAAYRADDAGKKRLAAEIEPRLGRSHPRAPPAAQHDPAEAWHREHHATSPRARRAERVAGRPSPSMKARTAARSRRAPPTKKPSGS